MLKRLWIRLGSSLRNPSVLGALTGCLLTTITYLALSRNFRGDRYRYSGEDGGIKDFIRQFQPLDGNLGSLKLNGANFDTSSAEKTYPVRKMLLAVVAITGYDLITSARKVNTSWGQDFEDWQLAVGAPNVELQAGESSHTLFAPQCQDFSGSGGGYLGPSQLFCLLRAVHDSHHSGYRWFILGHHAAADSFLYISVLRLERLLSRLDPDAVVYMGGSGDTSVPHCLGETGIVLSWRALRRIVPHLPSCLQEVATVGGATSSSVGGAEALGACFEAKLQTTCHRWDKSVQYFLSGFQGISTATQSEWAESHRDFVTVFPVRSPQALQLLHLTDLMRELRHLRWEIQRDSELLHNSSLCSLETEEVNLDPPLQASELKGWSVANPNSTYVTNNLEPRYWYDGEIKMEVEMVAKRGLAILNSRNSTDFQFKRVMYAYYRYRGTKGRETIIDVETMSKVILRLHILRPFLFQPILLEDSGPEAINKTIDFVVPISNVQSRFAEFMKTYEDVCLKFGENCRLNLVVYGSQDLQMIRSNLSLYSARYPQAQFNLVPGEGKFSRGRALRTGMETLPKSALAFTCDVDMTIDRSFLNHCRRNTIEGRRVYYPEVFKYYDMAYVYRFEPRPLFGYDISRKHGHWCTYGYGMLCIYKSDYDIIGGYDPTIEGWGGEDIELIDNIIARGLEVMRAPDPTLSHRYHPKICSKKLSKAQYSQCVTSRNEDIADRRRLADYIYYLENKCHIKKKIWD